MSILFKTYNRKHQLHIYKETWRFAAKNDIDAVLSLLPHSEMKKIKMRNVDNFLELDLNGIIIECADLKELKHKFGLLADMKEKFQK